MIKVGIVGGTGYTGVELLRLLVKHPQVKLKVITSRSEAGINVCDMFPNLRNELSLKFTKPNVKTLSKCDVVFFATPNGIAMQNVQELLDNKVKVIDLAADFRLKDPLVWKKWYGIEHTAQNLLDEAVYGLPEINREKIKSARLIACAGCYPTAVQLGFLPLLKKNIIKTDNLIADVKSGASGAGRKASVPTLLAEASENFKAYAVAGHRHLPEIKQGLDLIAKKPVKLTFVPHLLPMIRGIHATLYANLNDLNISQADLQELFEKHYKNEPFVDVMPTGSHPETRTVRGANVCRLSIFRPQDDGTIVVLSVIDNLVKGASGQAVQNMNLMFNLDENTGLDSIGLLP
jgi:N-acetyl-gamma-glutamyl-phosphate reductase